MTTRIDRDAAEAGTPVHSAHPRRRFRFLRGWRLALSLALVLVLATTWVRAVWWDIYYINSSSMEPTLVPGERILVKRDAGAPHRGDVVVFDGRGSYAPYERRTAADDLLRTLHLRGGDSVYVKRVLGVGGDTVECCDAKGRLLVNGVPLDEPYVQPGDSPSELRFSVEVPAHRLWLMGDHRSVSQDSRSLLGAPGGGMVAEDRVIGTVTRIVWPITENRPVTATGEQ